MGARNKKLDPTTIKLAAYLMSRGKSQKHVMHALDLSQPSASNAKRMAIERGWLTPPQLTLPLAECEQLEQLLHAKGLKAALVAAQEEGSRHLRTLRVFGVTRPARPGDLPAHQEHLCELGASAAQHLVEHVFPAVDTVGVSWGGTLLATARGLDPGRLARMERERPIAFFPVCGAPPDAATQALRSSSNLVAILDERVNGTMSNPNNFTGIAAAVSHRFDEAEAQVLWRYFRQDPGFARVFGAGEQEGLVDRMDAVLTGVGSPDPEEDPWVEGAAAAAGIEPAVLSESTFGNVAGTFLPRPGLDRAEAAAVDDANRRWTGVRLEHFQACARRAASAGRGGTILVASGAKKVEILLECVRRGLASELLIDAELAVALSKALQA